MTHHDTHPRRESRVTGSARAAHCTVRTHEGSSQGRTLEEGLIALLAVVAGILLFVGLAQALDARPSRRRRRRAVPPADASATLASAPPASEVTELAPRAPSTGPERRRSPQPGSRPCVRAAVPEAPPAVPPAPVETAAPPPTAPLSAPIQETTLA